MTLLLQSEAAWIDLQSERSRLCPDDLKLKHLEIKWELFFGLFEADWLRKAERRMAEEARVRAMEGIE